MSNDLSIPLIGRRGLLAGTALFVAGCEPVAPKLPEAHLEAIGSVPARRGMSVRGLDTAKFAGRVTVLNVWASWCPICRGEHDTLMALSADPRFVLAGLVFRDTTENARRYLETDGNPYAELSVDRDMTVSKSLGVRGVPYTFVFGPDRSMAFRHIGGLTAEIVSARLLPAVVRAGAPVQS